MSELSELFAEYLQKIKKEEYDAIIEPKNESIEKIFEVIKQNKNAKVYTAKKNGKLIGFGLLFVIDRVYFKPRYTAWLEAIYVREEYQKNLFSIGSRMIKQGSEYLKSIGVEVVEGCVYDTNKKAKKYWKLLGAKNVSTVVRYKLT